MCLRSCDDVIGRTQVKRGPPDSSPQQSGTSRTVKRYPSFSEPITSNALPSGNGYANGHDSEHRNRYGHRNRQSNAFNNPRPNSDSQLDGQFNNALLPTGKNNKPTISKIWEAVFYFNMYFYPSFESSFRSCTLNSYNRSKHTLVSLIIKHKKEKRGKKLASTQVASPLPTPPPLHNTNIHFTSWLLCDFASRFLHDRPWTEAPALAAKRNLTLFFCFLS